MSKLASILLECGSLQRPGCGRRWLALAVVATILVFTSQAGVADEPLNIRRIFVPADHPQAWPVAADKYLPIAPEEFEKLVEQADQPVAAATPPARIVAAVYRATWENGRLIGREAELDVVSEADEPVFLPLPELSIAIQEPQWQSADADPVLLGTHGQSGDLPTGFGVMVPGSDKLRFSWELNMMADSSAGESNVPLRLLPAQSNRLVLELPTGMRPRASEGVIVEEPPEANISNSRSTKEPSSEDSVDETESVELHEWTLLLPGNKQVVLHLDRAGEPAAEEAKQGKFAQHVTYELASEGLMLTARFQVDELASPVDQLVIGLDRRVQIASITIDDKERDWQIESNGGVAGLKATVDVAEPVTAESCTIVVNAWAPLLLDQPWDMPKVVLPDFSWMSGEFELVLPGEFELLDVAAGSGAEVIQTGVSLPTGAPETSTRRFAQLSASAPLNVAIRRRRPRLTAQFASRIELGSTECQARIVADVAVDVGQQFALSIPLAPEWTIESVVSEQPDELREWSIDKSGEDRLLRLVLDRPLEPSQPIRLVIDGRVAQGAVLSPVLLQSLQPLRGADFDVRRYVMQLVAEPDQRVKLQHVPSRLERASLTEQDRSRLDEPDEGILVDASDTVGNESVQLSSAIAEVSANLDVDVVVGQKRIDAVYRIEHERLSRDWGPLLVGFDIPLPENARWVDTDTSTTIMAHRADRRGTNLEAGIREVWNVPYDPTSDRQIEVRVSIPRSATTRLPLPSVVSMAQQEGTVVVRSAADSSPVIRPQGLTEILVNQDARREEVPVLAAFRFQPASDNVVGMSFDTKPASAPSDGSYIDWAEVTSAIDSNGSARHRVELEVISEAPASLQLELPSSADPDSLVVDESTSVLDGAHSGQAVELALPRGNAKVGLSFVTPVRATGFMEIESPLPAANVPILAGRWTIWAPPGVSATGTARSAGDSHASWRQRLFGRMARLDGRPPANPLIGRTWANWQLVDEQTSPPNAQVDQLMRRLESVASGQSEKGALAWGEMLVDLESTHSVWLDYYALAEAGLGPATTIESNVQRTADELLNSRRLALLVDGDSLVLTSRRVAAMAGDWVPTEPALPVFSLRQQPGASRKQQALPTSTVGPRVRPSDWQSVALPVQAGVANRGSGFVLPHTWHATETLFDAAGPPSIELVQQQSLRAYAWAAFLLATAVAVVLRRRYRSLLVVGLGLSVVGSLLLPPTLIIVSQASTLGFAVGLALRSLRNSLLSRTPAPRYRIATPTSALGVTLLGMLSMASLANAEDSPAQTEPAGDSAESTIEEGPAKLHQVLVPIDNQRQPVGAKIFVTEELLRELTARAETSTHPATDWTIQDASYHGEFSSGSGAVEPGTWTTRMLVEVFQRDTWVHLPFGRSQAEWPESAIVDGLPTELDWTEGTSGCAVFFSEPGQYRMTISFVPKVVLEEGRGRVELTIPRIANSRMQIVVPEDSPTFACENQDGQTMRASDDKETEPSFNLGTTEELRLSWPVADSQDTAQAIDEFIWVHVTEQGVRLDAKFAYVGSAAESEEVAIGVDPRMRLAEAGDQLRDGPPAGSSGELAELSLPLSPIESLDAHDAVSFELAEAGRYGRIQLPDFRFGSGKLRNRFLAVSCEPELACEVVADTVSPSLDVEDFMAAWGDADSTPQEIVQVSQQSPSTQFSVRPREQDSSADGSLSVVVGREDVQVRYDVDVLAGLGEQFQHQVRVPAGLSIDDVTVTTGGSPIEICWTRRDQQTIIVYFENRLDENYRLSVIGRLPMPDEKRMPLPIVSTMIEPIPRQRLLLFRQDNTRVAFEHGNSIREQVEATSARSLASARLIGTYWIEPDSGKSASSTDARIELIEGSPEASGESLTSIYREDGNWMVAWSCQLRVQRGLLDSLTLDVPESWSGPFSTQPGLSVEVAPGGASAEGSSDVGQNRLNVRLPFSLEPGADFKLELRGRWNPAAEQEPTIPEINVRDVLLASRYISVPSEVDGQPAVWSRVGVDWADDLPATLRPAPTAAGTTQLFQVVADPHLVRLQAGSRLGARAQASLIDMYVWQGTHGDQLVQTRFVLGASGVDEYRLHIPDDYQLVDIRLGGSKCRLQQSDERGWNVPVASSELPHVLEVVTRGSASRIDVGGRTEIVRPELLARGMEVQSPLTLCTLQTPGRGLQILGENSAPILPVDQSLLRLSQLLRTAETVSTPERQDTADAAEHWAQQWAMVLDAGRRQAAAAIAQQKGPSTRGQIPTQLPPVEQLEEKERQIEAWSARFHGAGRSGFQATGKRLDDPVIRGAEDSTTAYLIAEGAPDALQLTIKPTSSTLHDARWPAAVAVVLLTIVGLWIVRHAELRDLFWRWPQAMGVAVGWLWWAWLTPSALGLLIVAASLLLRIRSCWPVDFSRQVNTSPPSTQQTVISGHR